MSDNENNKSDGLSIFCREVRNLLRSKPNCMIPFSKFVPAYHNHYGRQCCVYQFGYTKLIELLESIPHVVQIIGDGTNRYITLTHREQIKRFASDLIKVVKSQPGKKLKLSQFALAYEQVLGKTFYVEDYGTNNINVLLAEIWEGTINIMPIKRELADEQVRAKGPLFVKQQTSFNNNELSTTTTTNRIMDEGTNLQFQLHNDNHSTSSSLCSPLRSRQNSILNQLVASCGLVNKPYITDAYPDAWFEIPKRERSEKEIKRTKYFVWDVVELLSNMGPEHSVAFSKFIPNYHYYFNRQCKVSIFGFSKLIDLLESISPDVVEIVDQGPGEEKLIKLAERFKPRSRDSCDDLEPNNKSFSHREIKINMSHASGSGSCNDSGQDDDDDDDEDEEYEANGEEEDEEEEEEVKYTGNERETARQELEEPESNNGDSSEDDEMDGDDLILPVQAIDSGPTEEELLELENELNAYEELKAIQSKRSSRMAAMLDIFRYSVY